MNLSVSSRQRVEIPPKGQTCRYAVYSSAQKGKISRFSPAHRDAGEAEARRKYKESQKAVGSPRTDRKETRNEREQNAPALVIYR